MPDQVKQLVGVDIGASFHQAHILAGRSSQRARIPASVKGHREFIRRLKPGHCRVVMEATGIYFLDLALDLVEAGIEVMVLNPRHAHHFAKALGKRSSTDPISAEVLAEFADRMPFRPWNPPPEKWYQFRLIARQINRLNGDLTAAKNRLHALEATRRSAAVVIDDEMAGIEALQRRIGNLIASAEQLLGSDDQLNRFKDHFGAAKGFGQPSVIPILGEMLLLPRSMNAKQCSSHAGLDVRLRKSGTSVEAKPRLSKVGNAYLRAPLYMPMLSVIQHEPLAKAHYERLISRGKTKKQAICALMRKYLTGFWAVLQNDEPFDINKLFAAE